MSLSDVAEEIRSTMEKIQEHQFHPWIRNCRSKRPFTEVCSTSTVRVASVLQCLPAMNRK